jgi:hypothetical protein
MGDCICVRRGNGPEGCGICNETETTPDIAGLCERLRVDLPINLDGSSAERRAIIQANTDKYQAADTLERQAAEIKRLRDKVEGLETDLRCAVQVAYNRGATEWARLNYPDMIEWLESCVEDRAALTGEDHEHP